MEPGAIKPLRLEAMTLRGLGSYLHGGRLEIRPLTVLCGTNGSGKSTWFRAIDLLRRSLEEGKLPFSFVWPDTSCEGGYWHDFTNAFVKFEGARHALLASAESDREFGPLGTIGLHLVADVDFDLNEETQCPPPDNLCTIAIDEPSGPQAFLWSGRCSRGTRLRLRISDASSDTFWLPRCVELLIGQALVIRFQETSERACYSASCTRAFWPGHLSDDLEHLEVALFDLAGGKAPSNVRGPAGEGGHDLLRQFCDTALLRIRQLLYVALSGIFWLSAIRPEYLESYVDSDEMEDESIIKRRWVGVGGQFTHALARRFAYNRMSLFGGAGRCGTNYQFWYVERGILDILRGLASSPAAPLVRRIWEGASAKTKEMLMRLPSGPLADMGRVYPVEVQRNWAKRLLNECLARRDLYHPSLAGFLNAESKELLDRGLEALGDADIERFNRMLVYSALSDYIWPHPGPDFKMFCDAWLRKMLGTSGGTEVNWTDPDKDPPSGFLERFRPDDQAMRTRFGKDLQGDLNVYTSPLFGETGAAGPPAAPGDMSSGFHQVAPMVVQAGLLRANEVLCIENPEVHLHPKLQLGVTEFLILQARIGKTIILETHSDLVIRRVMRAILQEDISQEAVRIHFTDVDLDSPSHTALGYASSRIQVIEINERGQIQNWPVGFMDDDIRESRRLLDLMYGTPGGDEGEEEAVL